MHSHVIYVIEQGIHSYTSEFSALRAGNCGSYILKCVIPKGAIYFHNAMNKEYVSNELVVKEVMMKKDNYSVFDE
jgi:hypothetical protein